MGKTYFKWKFFLSAMAIMGSLVFAAEAQNPGPGDQEVQDMARGMGIDARKCENLQTRIDQIVAIYESPISDNEKVASLSDAVAQSMAEMQQAASQDPEVEKAVNQYLGLMKELMAAARSSASGDDKKISDAAKDDLQKLKIMTSTYVQMMKALCPKLILPDVMSK